VVPLFPPSLRLWLAREFLAKLLPMTTSISHDHVGFSVTAQDLEPTTDWYESKLGYKVDQRFEAHGTTFVFLVCGNSKIELMAGATKRQAPTDDVLSSMDPARLHHFCLAVEDLDSAISELAENGVDLIGGPMEIDEIAQKIAFIPDNLGNIIELTEPGTGRSDR
jgi:catechol 2,3-dioxygenase-like lactoylglutathione lyase family enzyme